MDSYNKAVIKGYPFMSVKEYLLMTGFHKFITGSYIKERGLTRTSSLWNENYNVTMKYHSNIGALQLLSTNTANDWYEHITRKIEIYYY